MRLDDATWRSAIRIVGKGYGELAIWGDVLRDGGIDGYRVRVHFLDDAPGRFRVILVPPSDRVFDSQDLVNHVAACFDKVVEAVTEEKRIEERKRALEAGSVGAWSPYPQGAS